MIRSVAPKDVKAILNRGDDPVMLVRVQALAKAYGARQRFFELWRHNRSGLIARLDGSFELACGAGSDPEELAAFLLAHPSFEYAAGEASLLKKIAAFFPQNARLSQWNILTCKHPLPPAVLQDKIERSPRLRDIYDVMQAVRSNDFVVGEFSYWYVDISHRVRHGCAAAYLLSVEGAPAGCCLISAYSNKAGLLTGLAVKPAFRGRGIATALLAAAAGDLLRASRLPLLECGDALLPFYEKRGFSLCPSRRAVLYRG